MTCYLILLRGINVGGLNKVPMAGLKSCLEDLGFDNVSTYIASGNAFVQSKLGARAVEALIDKALPKTFKLDSELVRVLAVPKSQLQSIIANKPKGFGEKPDTYHSDAIFLMGITVANAMPVFSPRDGVDVIWPGKGVIYSQRLRAERTKSRLNRIMGTAQYTAMTLRSWRTTTKQLELMQA